MMASDSRPTIWQLSGLAFQRRLVASLLNHFDQRRNGNVGTCLGTYGCFAFLVTDASFGNTRQLGQFLLDVRRASFACHPLNAQYATLRC